MIKPRIGQCLDCPTGESRELMAKRCFKPPFFHYQKHQQSKYRKSQSEKAKVKAVAGGGELTLGKWFNQQINNMPSYCENCGEHLNKFAPWSARAYIAHIVPKRFFVSVQTHPLNRMFLCIDCHTKFDNSLSREIVMMNCYPVAVQRFKQFMEDIAPSEVKHLQEFLRIVYFEEK